MIIKSALKSYSVEMIDSFAEKLYQDHSDNTYYVIDENVIRLHLILFRPTDCIVWKLSKKTRILIL